MGFIGDTADKVRQFFRGDKERAQYNLAKSATHSPYMNFGYGQVGSFGYDALSDYLELEQDILNRYADYEAMQEYELISSALDIMADDATQLSLSLKRTAWVTSSDRSIQRILDDLFQRKLRIDEEIWEIARMMCMYGSAFEEVLLDETGVCGLNFMPTPTVRRIEGPRGELEGFIQDYRGKYGFQTPDLKNLLQFRNNHIENPRYTHDPDHPYHSQNPTVGLEPWEVVHFRTKGAYRRSVYGFSTLEPVRWTWKRLVLLEDAVMIYRLQRAPERFSIGVDVGDLPAGEVLPYLQKFKQMMKKKRYVDPGTGKIQLRMDTISPDEDFIYAVRKGVEGAKIQTLTSPSWQSVVDTEYFLDKMIAGLKIPKAYLGREEGVVRASLSTIDIRFCKTIMRIQRELINGLEKVCRIHLSSLGIDPDAVDFEVHMTPPSALMEMGQIEAQTAKAQLATALREHVSLYWVLQNVMGLSDEEIQGIMKQREDELTHDIMVQMQAQGQAQVALQAMMPQPQMGPAQMDPNTMADLKAQGDGTFQQTQLPPDVQQPQTLAGGGAPNRQPVFSNFVYKPYRAKPLTESELFKNSNKETEKRAMEKLETLAKNDKNFMRDLEEIKSSLKDIAYRNRIQ